jgi:hypothetical protein
VKETLAVASRLALQVMSTGKLAPMLAEFENADALFDHVLTFEDTPFEGPVDAEELHVDAEDVDTESEEAQAHLVARSLDALEARAKRAREAT